MSTKRSVGQFAYDDDEDYVPSKAVKYSEREDVMPKKEKKHTLDSDEEDNDDDDNDEVEGGKNYDILKEEDIDGQEEQTVDFEGETKITPFNMKEEMEDGHFDGDGFYHFKKEAEIKDAWLDDIDWIKIKHKEGDEKKYGSDIESDSDNDPLNNESDVNTISVYEEILAFVNEGETIAKALKRLGGNKKMSSAQKWKLKKAGNLGSAGGDNMANFLKLTELANKIIETGNMDIYQETFEMITLKIKRSKAPSPSPALDMFAEEVKQEDKSEEKSSKTNTEKEPQNTIETVSWELRWEDKDDAEIHGPFTTEKMIEWQESGYFKKGAYVKKTTDSSNSWYSTRRIEFDLYT